MRSMSLCWTIALVAGVVLGCTPQAQDQQPSPQAQASRLTITEHDWELYEIGDMTNPLGAGGRPVTMRLDSATTRVAGFAGCNQYSGPYTLRGDSLTFGPPISTKMACAEGMHVETRFLGGLPSTRAYEITDSTLTLLASDGPLARFRVALPDTIRQ
jgi:heat shock protein HslJ